jgi:hypothetical protein
MNFLKCPDGKLSLEIGGNAGNSSEVSTAAEHRLGDRIARITVVPVRLAAREGRNREETCTLLCGYFLSFRLLPRT